MRIPPKRGEALSPQLLFMILCGINFNLYYLLLLRQWRSVLRSDELWTYLGLVVMATGVITLDLRGVYGGLGTCLRQAAFQVLSNEQQAK